MANPDPLKNIRVVLCETAHPGNVGAAARAMKTMGLASLVLVRPERFPDPQANWRASRATDVLERARVVETLDDALAGTGFAVACTARPRDIAVAATDARDAAARLIEAARAQPVALVFGNETYGLTTTEVNRCRLMATIPADPEYASLNLAAAVQVMAYELRMAALGAETPAANPPTFATHEELEALYTHLDDAMVRSGFVNPAHPKKLKLRVRRLFSRAALEHEEVNILRGLLKALENPRRKP